MARISNRRVRVSNAGPARPAATRNSAGTAANHKTKEPQCKRLVTRTLEACRLAHEAAGIAAEVIATGSLVLLQGLRERERKLDELDREIDSGVTESITEVSAGGARELLACMKITIGVERIGDLLLSFASGAEAAGSRVDPQDCRDLTRMATVLEKMLADVEAAFAQRDAGRALEVLRADTEIDRLRDLILQRHLENPENIARHASTQVIFMTQSLERAGDHAKNSAEEVCHLVSGRPVRHLMTTSDMPVEQMVAEWLQARGQ